MRSFLLRHQSEVKGVLSGFDRLRFRGTLLLVANLEGLACWLRYRKILLKSFRDYAMGVTETIKRTTQHLAEQAGRPLQYLASSTNHSNSPPRRPHRQHSKTHRTGRINLRNRQKFETLVVRIIFNRLASRGLRLLRIF